MEPRMWGQLLGEAADYLRDDTVRIPTGFPTLDGKMRGGLRPGHVALFLGRTGVGKTAATVQMTVSAALAGHPVAFASLEMSRQEMTVRALSAHLDMALPAVENLLASGEPDERLLAASQALKFWAVDDSTTPGWDDLSVWVDKLEKTLRARPSVVVVDHLKLMKRYGYPRGEVERVQQLAEDAKRFAKNAGVALIVIHQVSRSTDSDGKNHGHLPLTMEDGMYAGEQDADYIFGVYRPELNPKMEDADRRNMYGRTYIQLLKNRHGEALPAGVATMWKRPSMRFEELRERPTVVVKEWSDSTPADAEEAAVALLGGAA